MCAICSDLKNDARNIFMKSVSSVMPDVTVARALDKTEIKSPVTLIAIGKAAWKMAKSASDILGAKIKCGVVLTKYGHAHGAIGNLQIYEAGHPIPDENGTAATQKILAMTKDLTEKDTVLFLISGGGSALFDAPCQGVTQEFLAQLSSGLIASGADINEINTIRKRFSQTKGGRFALHCAPAKIHQIILSDIVGDNIENIASGPATPDSATSSDALAIIEKYKIDIPEHLKNNITQETPKHLDNVTTSVGANVKELCLGALKAAAELGYTAKITDSSVTCPVEEAAKRLIETAKAQNSSDKPLAIITGGETTVKLLGKGKGGRAQQFALICAKLIQNTSGTVILAGGSDGTDGPTDAAGGIVDGSTWNILEEKGLDPEKMLKDNNAYNALAAADALLTTGPTGTNVNDLMLILVGCEESANTK